MATDKPRITFYPPRSLYQQLVDFQKNAGYESMSQLLTDAIAKGLPILKSELLREKEKL